MYKRNFKGSFRIMTIENLRNCNILMLQKSFLSFIFSRNKQEINNTVWLPVEMQKYTCYKNFTQHTVQTLFTNNKNTLSKLYAMNCDSQTTIHSTD